MPTIHILRVFTDVSGNFGNPLGVILAGHEIAAERRQALAAELGFSELVFVDDPAHALVQIFTPTNELSFAGHPLVGTSWLLRQQYGDVSVLRPPAGDVHTYFDGMSTWIRGRAAWSPAFEHIQLRSSEEVDAAVPTPTHDFTQFWAWQDQSAGRVRARVFASRIGVVEDEACGAASLLLAHALEREIIILHGCGSLIYARPSQDGTVEVGGGVVLDEVREID